MPSSSAIERFKLLKGASERSRLRKDRIAQLEQEQTAEDMEALAMTEVCTFHLFQLRNC